jgi:hypothetical protein
MLRLYQYRPIEEVGKVHCYSIPNGLGIVPLFIQPYIHLKMLSIAYIIYRRMLKRFVNDESEKNMEVTDPGQI